MASKTTATVVMWIATVLLILGIFIAVIPMFVKSVFGKDIGGHRPWRYGTSTQIEMGRLMAGIGSSLVLGGFIAAMVSGIVTTHGKQTFMRMYI